MRLFWTILYRAAYMVMNVYWFLRGRRPEGAFVAMWCDGRILLVRTSYQRFHTFPGGGRKRNEPHLETALREAREEVGVALSRQMLRRVDGDVDPAYFARERIVLYEAHFDQTPDIQVDGREIVSAEWFDLTQPETQNLWPLFMTYMKFKREQLAVH